MLFNFCDLFLIFENFGILFFVFCPKTFFLTLVKNGGQTLFLPLSQKYSSLWISLAKIVNFYMLYLISFQVMTKNNFHKKKHWYQITRVAPSLNVNAEIFYIWVYAPRQQKKCRCPAIWPQNFDNFWDTQYKAQVINQSIYGFLTVMTPVGNKGFVTYKT